MSTDGSSLDIHVERSNSVTITCLDRLVTLFQRSKRARRSLLKEQRKSASASDNKVNLLYINSDSDNFSNNTVSDYNMGMTTESNDNTVDTVENKTASRHYNKSISSESLDILSDEDDDHRDEVDSVTNIIVPIPRRRSVLRPDLDELIKDLDDEALQLNEIIIRNNSKGETALFTKHNIKISKVYTPRTYEPGARRPSGFQFGPPQQMMSINEDDENGGVEYSSFMAQKPLSDLKYQNLLPPNPCLRILLVFPKSDNVHDALHNACLRLNYDVTTCKSTSSAIELFSNPTNGGQHIVVVDGRNTKNLDPEEFGRSIRNTKGSQYTIMVAILKKRKIFSWKSVNFTVPELTLALEDTTSINQQSIFNRRASTFEKDDTTVLSLLDAGYNRCLIESPHISTCCSELRQIQHSLVRPQNVISTQQALYTALHRTRDPMIITDDLLRTQYANKATERMLNIKSDEIVGRPLAELLNADVTPITMQTNRHREYDGVIPIKKKNLETVSMHVRVTPVICIGRNPTHLVISIDLPGQVEQTIATIQPMKEAPRGSLHSIRRGSFDVRSITSDGLRRTSLAKLSSLPLEAPITKVLTLLSQVQENCSPDESRLLDKVMEFLKREGLYSPQMKEIKTDDPVANDLIGALLLQGPTNMLSSRRSSNDSIIRGNRQSSITPVKLKGSTQLSDLLDKSLDWDFDIFRLEEITEKRPLLYIGLELFRRFNFYDTFNIDETTTKSWLIVMEAHYHSANTYHNSTHAADVMQATAAFLQQLSRKGHSLETIDDASVLIAAATHDIDHPGRSSAFLCNSDNILAILYNDSSVLESHHAATTFKLTLADEKINIFKNLDKDNYKSSRSIIIDMILATEMTKHFEHLAKFVSVFSPDGDPRDAIYQDTDENTRLIRRMLIKCADVSNPARPLTYCVEWARRIAEEYFTQTDEEKKRLLPIVMPMFDRATCSISKSQIGFIEYIIMDMLQAWDNFIEMPELMQYMNHNYSQWKLFEQQDIHTLHDIKAKQITLMQQSKGPDNPNRLPE